MTKGIGCQPGTCVATASGGDSRLLRWPVLLVGALCMSLAACGGGGGGGGGSTPTSSSPSISFDPASTSFTSDRANPKTRSIIVLTLENTTTAGLFVSGTHTNVAIYHVGVDMRDANIITVLFSHRPPTTFFNGTYTDTLVLNVCLDEACTKPLKGSPLTIPITNTVTGTDSVTGLTGPPPDPNAPPLAEPARKRLAHDVVNAEYIRSADRIVMTSAYPSNALYVYDVVTGIESSMQLSAKPTALSISPDGATVAVGHANFISLVSLADVGQDPTRRPQELPVSATVFDLVLDGAGRVHYIGSTEEPTGLHSVDIGTGIDTPSNGMQLYGRSYARLHPSGNFIFTGDTLISPASMDKWDISGASARYVSTVYIDSLFIDACGTVWFNESGTHVYSRCGFAGTTDVPPYVSAPSFGRLELSGAASGVDAYIVAWMDHWSPSNEISLLESNSFWCNDFEFGVPCYPQLGVFDSETLTKQTLHALAPISVNGTLHAQRGLFVFYKSDGTRRYLITRLDAMSDRDAEYYLSEIE